jgi:hypothetical protein
MAPAPPCSHPLPDHFTPLPARSIGIRITAVTHTPDANGYGLVRCGIAARVETETPRSLRILLGGCYGSEVENPVVECVGN